MLQPCSMKLDGEPVEQLGVGRRRPLAAEVEDRRHQRRAEVAHPDVIDRDAGRQRMPPVGHPSGERGAAAGAGRREGLVARLLGLEVRLGRLPCSGEWRVGHRSTSRPPCGRPRRRPSRRRVPWERYPSWRDRTSPGRRGRGLPRPSRGWSPARVAMRERPGPSRRRPAARGNEPGRRRPAPDRVGQRLGVGQGPRREVDLGPRPRQSIPTPWLDELGIGRQGPQVEVVELGRRSVGDQRQRACLTCDGKAICQGVLAVDVDVDQPVPDAHGQFVRVAQSDRSSLRRLGRVEVDGVAPVGDLQLRARLVGTQVDEHLASTGRVEAQARRAPGLAAGNRESDSCLELGRRVEPAAEYGADLIAATLHELAAAITPETEGHLPVIGIGLVEVVAKEMFITSEAEVWPRSRRLRRLGQPCSRLLQRRAGRCDLRRRVVHLIVGDERPQSRNGGLGREADWLDLQVAEREDRRQARL